MTAPPRAVTATFALVRRPADPSLVEVEVLAREAGMHPDLVRRAAARRARAGRLRRDLGLSYAGAVLASQLLSRIDELEDRLRRSEAMPNHRRTPWTPTS
jgi:hypothetical protein